MIRWTSEGAKLHNGFNIYRPSDIGSAGFKFRLGRFIAVCRWSKFAKRWHLSAHTYQPLIYDGGIYSPLDFKPKK